MNPPLRLAPLPRPGRPTQERRRHRPSGAGDALVCALEAAAVRSGLDAVLIADNRGMLVARTSGRLDLDELAAVTPIVARGMANARVMRKGRHREFQVHTLDMLGETLYVATLGSDRGACTRAACESVKATSRILAA